MKVIYSQVFKKANYDKMKSVVNGDFSASSLVVQYDRSIVGSLTISENLRYLNDDKAPEEFKQKAKDFLADLQTKLILRGQLIEKIKSTNSDDLKEELYVQLDSVNEYISKLLYL